MPRRIAAWFVIVGLVMLARESCELAGLRFMWVDGWLHIGRMHPPAVLRVLAGLALPFAAAFLYVGARFERLLAEGSELPFFIASFAAGRALLQVVIERSFGFELSLAPLAGMAFLAWYLRRSVTQAVNSDLLTRT